LVSVWTNAIIGRFLNLGFGPGTIIPFDGRVLAFAAGSALLSGLAFSLLPAWLSARTSAADALKENARGSSGGRGQQRLKNVLMIGQIAAAGALVSITISFAVGLKSFVHRDTGWRMDNLFTGDVVLPAGTYDKPARRNAFTRALLDRLTALPGVDHAALAGSLPLFYFGGASPVIVEGRPADAPGHEPVAYSAAVTSDYFSTLGIPLEKGAVFAPHLTADDPPVAIINASFARQFWPGTSPIGHRFRLGADEPWLEIVGVVGDVQIATGLSPQASRLQLYRPLVQAGNRYFTIALHSSTLAPAMLVKTVLATVATLDGDLPVSNAGSVTARLESAFSNNDLIIVNFSISAGMGLLIAAIGLSGVISQLVQQRRRDIGIRLALGAVSANILRLLLGEGLKLLAAGLVLGVAGYYALHAVLHRAMSEVQFPGLWLLAINLAILSAVMAVACWLPARRATKVDPLTALRAE
jgi:predicted permease